MNGEYIKRSDLMKRKEVISFEIGLLLSAFSVGILLISNISAVKIWDFFGIPVDGGILLFPLSYIVGDLIVEFYGEKISRNVTVAGFVVNILAILVFTVVRFLPAYSGWENQNAFDMIFGFEPRIVIGSLLAYFCSQMLNIFVFCRIKKNTDKKLLEKKFFKRAVGSSLIAHLIDSLIFETVAFFGVLSFKEFLFQMLFAYFAGVVLEILLFPLTNVLAKKLRPIVNLN